MNEEKIRNCFTEVENGVNAEFNKVTMKCLNSSNNAFSMDCEGNLVVNSIRTREGSGGLTFDDIYPIGSIYMSIQNENPTQLFGGTWESIKDKFLLSSGDTYEVGVEGGEAEHTLSINEIPSHSHTPSDAGRNWVYGTDQVGRRQIATGNTGLYVPVAADGINGYKWGGTSDTGGNKSHNNMPLYLTVNMWKRVAKKKELFFYERK